MVMSGFELTRSIPRHFESTLSKIVSFLSSSLAERVDGDNRRGSQDLMVENE